MTICAHFRGKHFAGLRDWARCHDNRALGDNGNVVPEEFSVPKGDTPRAIYANDVLVELTYFHDDSSFMPFFGMWADLVLDPHVVPNFEWG